MIATIKHVNISEKSTTLTPAPHKMIFLKKKMREKDRCQMSESQKFEESLTYLKQVPRCLLK